MGISLEYIVGTYFGSRTEGTENELAEGVQSVLYFGVDPDMKNWKQMAQSAGLDIPDVERLKPALDALEAAFRPLVKTIPHDVEPALMFRATAEELPEEQS
jgi:hypothetical protein